MPQTNHIGNRLQTKAGGDERGSAALRAAVYSANNLAALIALFGVGLTLSAPLDGGRVKNEHAIVLPYDPSVSGQFDPATDGPDRFCPQLAGFDLPDDMSLSPKTGPVVKLNFSGVWPKCSRHTDESKTQTIRWGL